MGVARRVSQARGAEPAQAAAFLQDPRISWIVDPVHKHRELRGLTSTGKKYRGLRHKGHSANKVPSPARPAPVWARHSLLPPARALLSAPYCAAIVSNSPARAAEYWVQGRTSPMQLLGAA